MKRFWKIKPIVAKAALCVATVVITLLIISPHSSQDAPQSTFTEEAISNTPAEEKPLIGGNSRVSSVATKTSEPEQQIPPRYKYTDAEADMLARVVFLEAGGCAEEEQRLVVWTVFQRVDSTDWDFRNMNTITDVVTAPYQFAYYETAPIKDEIRRMCEEELEKWAKGGSPPVVEPYAPSLPYFFYEGDGRHNWFRAGW